MNFLLGYFDFFLPSSVRKNPADLMRGYILIGLIFSNIVVSIVVAFGLLFYLELEENTTIGVALDLTCLVSYLITLYLLRRTENYVLCTNFLISTLTLVIFFGVQITGGYLDSPILQLALQIPVMAFLLLGLRSGVFWLAGTIFLCIACYVSAILDLGYSQMLQNRDLVEAMYISLQFLMLIMLGGALMIYETINGLLNKTLKEERNRFEHKASHDHLTGIPNRFEFFRRLRGVTEDAREQEQKVGVVYIDLDCFKRVNDIHGHHMGDEALKAVAGRLKHVLRVSDTTARLGGDEFGLILPGIHVPHDIETIMPKVLEAIKQPIVIGDVEFVVYASCGVAIYPNHSEDYNALCRFADAAMYKAKETQDSFLVYDQAMIT
jgi:diguanylate cyclase (GGDEF)-like protein